jgi:hypothetical protein
VHKETLETPAPQELRGTQEIWAQQDPLVFKVTLEPQELLDNKGKWAQLDFKDFKELLDNKGKWAQLDFKDFKELRVIRGM